jgi:hypothetical protein
MVFDVGSGWHPLSLPHAFRVSAQTVFKDTFAIERLDDREDYV